MKVTDVELKEGPDRQSRGPQSCWRLSPLWRPFKTSIKISYSGVYSQKGNPATLGNSMMIWLPEEDHSSFEAPPPARASYSGLWKHKAMSSVFPLNKILQGALSCLWLRYLQRPAVDFCRSLNIEKAGPTSVELKLLVFVLNCSSFKLFTRLVRMPLMAPILYGNLARLSAKRSFLWSLLQPGEDQERSEEKSRTHPGWPASVAPRCCPWSRRWRGRWMRRAAARCPSSSPPGLPGYCCPAVWGRSQWNIVISQLQARRHNGRWQHQMCFVPSYRHFWDFCSLSSGQWLNWPACPVSRLPTAKSWMHADAGDNDNIYADKVMLTWWRISTK